EREGKVSGQRALREAEALDEARRVRRAECVHDANRYQVARSHERLAQTHGAAKFARVVLRAPACFERRILDHERRIVDDARRREALIERGRVEERLERRPGLASGLNGTVVVAGVIVEAADERRDRAVLRVERDESAL